MGLSEQDRVKMLEEIAADTDLKATMRLRAIEELGRIEARRAEQGKQAAPAEEELPPDPFADMDEMEQQRQRRSRTRVPVGLAPRAVRR